MMYKYLPIATKHLANSFDRAMTKAVCDNFLPYVVYNVAHQNT